MDSELVTRAYLYAGGAAILYALHQVFTKLAADHVDARLGGFVVEATAAVMIGAYILLAPAARDPGGDARGALFSVLAGVCVGVGTILFFRFFRTGGQVTAVPAILAAGSSLMVLTGVAFLGESPTPRQVVAVGLSLIAMLALN